jgi:hypothetical protein
MNNKTILLIFIILVTTIHKNCDVNDWKARCYDHAYESAFKYDTDFDSVWVFVFAGESYHEPINIIQYEDSALTNFFRINIKAHGQSSSPDARPYKYSKWASWQSDTLLIWYSFSPLDTAEFDQFLGTNSKQSAVLRCISGDCPDPDPLKIESIIVRNSPGLAIIVDESIR